MLALSYALPVPTSPARLASPARAFVLAPPGHPQRAAIERFVATVYRARFGARVRGWAPTLVGLTLDGHLVAAAGYRCASEPLYLERYLAEPIEAAIRARTGVEVERAALVEIGHFAATRHGEGRRLMTRLARHLHATGTRWAATTATRELRHLYERLGLTAWRLADATRDAAGSDATDWGTYYDHEPAVVAGPIARNLVSLEQRAA